MEEGIEGERPELTSQHIFDLQRLQLLQPRRPEFVRNARRNQGGRERGSGSDLTSSLRWHVSQFIAADRRGRAGGRALSIRSPRVLLAGNPHRRESNPLILLLLKHDAGSCLLRSSARNASLSSAAQWLGGARGARGDVTTGETDRKFSAASLGFARAGFPPPPPKNANDSRRLPPPPPHPRRRARAAPSQQPPGQATAAAGEVSATPLLSTRTTTISRWTRHKSLEAINKLKSSCFHQSQMMAGVTNGNSHSDIQRKYQVVVAATREMGIGKDGALPWKLPSDLKFFKDLTMATADPSKKNAVIMGRKTWESIPTKFRPLPGRLNVILTRSDSSDYATVENVVTCGSLDSSLELLASAPYSSTIEKAFLIGGGQVLRELLNASACEAIHLTDIESTIECDTFIPPIDPLVFHPWYSSSPVVENNIRHSFATFVRVRKSAEEANDSNLSELTSNDAKKKKFEIQIFSFLPKMIFEKHDEYQYLNLVQDILRSGARKNDRTGTGTISKFGCQMRFNLRKNFPLLTTKRVFWRGVLEELLWFISGSTNAKVLQEKNIRIWDGNASREYLDR
uniref:dihydrofolate reductase n=1 Tax=Aegilops tauschii subsp. strangulata TaxID=200361 RepID=A0A453D8Z4_AEGTS